MTQITREKNVQANVLVRLVASLVVMQTTILSIYYQDGPSILEREQVNQVYDIHGNWMEPIIKYLETGKLLEDELLAHWIRIKFA